MTSGELKILFRAIQDTSVKKVIDNVKGDVRSIGSVMDGVSKKMGRDIFSNISESFKKLNPELMKQLNVIKPPSQAGGPQGINKLLNMGPLFKESVIKGLREPGGADLAKVMAMGEFNASGKSIKGLRDVTGKDLAKVQSMGEFGKYEGAPPPILKEKSELPSILRRFASESYLSYKALQLLRSAIDSVVNEFKKVFEFSHQLYGKSLSSGLSLPFMAQRQMTASTLGVPETEIFRFAQSAMVMKQLSGAVGEISKNAPQLAYTKAQFKILEFNVLALGSKLAKDLTPALNGLAVVLEKLLNVLNNSVIEKILKGIGGGILRAAFGNLAVEGGKLGVSMLQLIGKSSTGTFGQPQSFMKQFPAGAFEKMGLIIGGGMANKALEYQRRTATAVEKLYHAATQPNQPKGSWYMNRSQFVNGY